MVDMTFVYLGPVGAGRVHRAGWAGHRNHPQEAPAGSSRHSSVKGGCIS